MIKLSECELEVMNVIWRKNTITSGEVIQALKEKKWNENTIRTFIKRLLNKKAIMVYEKRGKQNIYQSNIDRKVYIKEMVIEFIQKCKRLEN